MRRELIYCNNRFYLKDENGSKVYHEIVFTNMDDCSISVMNEEPMWGFFGFDKEEFRDIDGQELILHIKDGKYGLGRRNEIALEVPLSYDEINEYGKGLFALKDGKSYKIGLINHDGFQALDGYYDEVLPIVRDRCRLDDVFILRKDDKQRLCSISNGKLLLGEEYNAIDILYSDIRDMYEVALEKDGIKYFGVIDNRCETIIECQYLHIDIINEKSQIFSLEDVQHKYIIYDAKQHQVVFEDIDYVDFYDGYIILYKDGMQGLLGYDGRLDSQFFKLPYNYQMDTTTYGLGYVVVHDLNNNGHVGVARIDNSTTENVQIYTQDDWEEIPEGFTQTFDEGIRIRVLLKSGEWAYYDENFHESNRMSENEHTVEEDSRSDIDDEYYRDRKYEDADDSIMDAFEGDPDAYWNID